jgi:long-chain acyl-CoA synthetase
VGKPLAGVEIKIDGADDVGVGEVLARGPNIMQGYYGDEEATKATLSEGWFKTGDLGRVDEEGNLFIVGRQKDVIVDRDGRNVYPDELEELYGNHDAISELSVVGVVQPDGNEKVACLIVLDDQGVEDTADERERQREAIGQHFRAVSEGVPYFKRVKILHFWEGELPRTATRKVKRAEVSALVERLERVRSVAPVSATPGAEGSDMEVARHLVASLCGKSVVEISGSTRLAGDLSFDSLMMVELASALDGRVRGELRSDDVLAVETVGDIARLLGGGSGSRRPLRKRRSKAVIIGDVSGERDEQGDGEYEIPEVIASLGKRGLAWGQRQFYGRLMETEISGAGYIPSHDNFLVASNHCSHLDTGLVRQALGVYGKNMVTLAARDYFFESKVRRAYFENFTNIMAMERHGGVKQSLRRAVEALRTGKTLLIFPEGTRSDTGEMGTFKTAVGYLAVHSRKAVLPMYLSGTRDAMPKGGSLVPSQRRIGCRMGPALEWPHFELLLAGRSRSEAYRLCTLLVERAVTELREVSGYRPEELVETLLSELREQTLSEGVAGIFSGGDEGESPAGGAPEAILNQEPRSGLHSDGIQA